MCVFVCANAETQLPGRLRLLVEERIAYIGITLDILVFVVVAVLINFFKFLHLIFLVFANQATVHNGGVSMERVCSCGCWH